jgi:hypothetical protein
MRRAPGFHRPARQQKNKNEAEHHLFLFGKPIHAAIIASPAVFQRKIRRRADCFPGGSSFAKATEDKSAFAEASADRTADRMVRQGDGWLDLAMRTCSITPVGILIIANLFRKDFFFNLKLA